MKISNSKKKLAKIISENGGWLDGCDFVVQDKDSFVCFYEGKPTRCGDSWEDKGDCQYRCGFNQDGTIQNWHQTILSRDEYFHLHPAPDAELAAMCSDVTEENKHPEYCESVIRPIPEPSDKLTIEQLAADYKAKLAISQQAQEEADSRRADAEAALDRLYQAGLEIGLDIAIASKEDEDEGEPELVITDWRQWQVGDCISWSIISTPVEYKIISVHHDEHREIGDFEIMDGNGNVFRCYGDECKFIRRP